MMVEEPENLVLQMLRRVETKLDRVIDDLGDPKIRMTHVEEGLVGVNRRLDRMETRIDRIGKRLDLVDHPYGGVRE